MGQLVLAFMDKYDAPALSFAIGYGGEITHADAFGFVDRERIEQVSPAHRFRIASVSKTLTSATIFSLIEQGRITLSDKVFGPGAVLGTDFGRQPYSAGIDQITLEHLLMHTAGGWTNGHGDPMFRPPNMSHSELITWVLANRPLDHPPGTTPAYSNFGYCVLGRVIEKLTRQPYADYVRGQILNRCGVTEMTIAGNTLEQRQSGEVKYYAQGGENPYGMNVRRIPRGLRSAPAMPRASPSTNTVTCGTTARCRARRRLPCARAAASAGQPSPTHAATTRRSTAISIASTGTWSARSRVGTCHRLKRLPMFQAAASCALSRDNIIPKSSQIEFC
jgi:CubicO group peptidase (beta-lactamase class C family)